MDKGRIVSDHSESGTCEEGMKFGHCKYQGQNFTICRTQFRFSVCTVPGSASDDVAFIVSLPLFQDGPQSVMGVVCVHNERPVLFWHGKDRFRHKGVL